MLSGIWGALGLSVWEAKYSASLPFPIAGLIFFVVPVALFVFGLDYSNRWKDAFRSAYPSRSFGRQWHHEKEVGIRAVLWFLGGALSGTLYSLFVIVK
jgi:hypothetical protein